MPAIVTEASTPPGGDDARKHRRACIAIALGFAVLYVALSFCHAGDSFMDDETWEFYASKTLLEEGSARTVTGETNVYHPHGYYYVLGAAFRLFGIHEIAARLVGITATLLCFALILAMTARLVGRLDPVTCFLVGTFYLFAPAVIQGALIITADTAVHHLLVTALLYWAVCRYPFRAVDALVLPVLVAVALWIKFVTPVLVVGAIVLFALLRRDWKQAAWVATVAGAGGFALFYGTWCMYCAAIGANPHVMFEYLVQTARSRAVVVSPAAKGVWLARQALTVIMWLGLPYVVLMLRAAFTWRRWRAGLPPGTGILLVAGLVLAVVYTFIAGASYGYPRYHFTMLPAWAVAVALSLRPALSAVRIRWSHAMLFVAGLACYFFFVVGDPLRAASFELKLARLGFTEFGEHSTGAVARTLLLAALPTVMVLALFSGRLFRAPWLRAVALPGLVMATSASLNGIQARADYQTNLSYAEHGTREMLGYLRARIGSDREIIAGKDTVYHVLDRGYMDDWRWTERDYLLARLRDPRTQFLVMGIHHNSLDQLQSVRDDAEFRALLESDYRRSSIGSYLIWERRLPDTVPPPAPPG